MIKILEGHEYQDKLEYNLSMIDKLDSKKCFPVKFRNILFQDIAEIVSKDSSDNIILIKKFPKLLFSLTKHFISLNLYFLLGYRNLNKKLKSRYLLSFFDTHRKDKIEMFNNIIEEFKSDSFVIDTNYLRKIKYMIDLVNLFKKLKILYLFFISCRFNFLINPLFNKIKLGLKLLKYINFYYFVNNNIIWTKYDAYISFTDYAPYDNIITQAAKNNNLLCFTCQHGVYHVNPRKKALLGNISHENFISDYMFCWGKDIIDRLNKTGRVNKNRLIESCHPNRKKYRTDIDFLKTKIEFNHIVILMSQARMDHSNEKMLKVIQDYTKKHNIKYSLKLHPSLSEKKYNQLTDNDMNLKEISRNNKLVIDFIDKKTIFICHTTTAYYEILSFGVPCFRFNDESLRPFVGLDDKFKNLNELEKLINNLPVNRKKWYAGVNEIIIKVFGEYNNNPSLLYKNIVNKKIKEKIDG